MVCVETSVEIDSPVSPVRVSTLSLLLLSVFTQLRSGQDTEMQNLLPGDSQVIEGTTFDKKGMLEILVNMLTFTNKSQFGENLLL